MTDIPTLYDWAGGAEALLALTTAFYAKVPDDPVLAPIFAHMDNEHPQHVAAFVGEVLGGPRAYTAGGGSHAGMIGHHLGRHLTQPQRKR